MNNDFKEFKGVMTKVRKRQVDKSYEIYMALYQGVTGEEDYKNIYKDFSPDFFDLIVVDECHREARLRIRHGERYSTTTPQLPK